MALSRRLTDLIDRTRTLFDPPRAAVPATVPVCRCAGRCRCVNLVPALLLRQIERECEFYRSVL